MSECIHWTGEKTYDGYGRKFVKGRRHQAHRLAWVDAYGPIPVGLCVLHTCDQPSCVNVEHLWLGTRADNNTDRARKGRSAAGKRNGKAKISTEQVAEIRNDTRSASAIAVMFGISAKYVQAIRRGDRRQVT